jgi:hypothetical protein
MSCFETSIFLSNPDEHLLISVAKAACDALNWQYKQNANRLYITDVGQSTDLNGEYALAIIGNKLMKNNFYLGDSAPYYVEQLLQKYNKLLPNYEKQVIVTAFEQQGYGYMDQSEELAENPKLVFSFAMQAKSKLQNETDRMAKIHVTISNQGNIVTESNYIPVDIHAQADHAMANIELKLGMKRRVYPKEIPRKYAQKAFCQPKNDVLTQ